MRLLHPRSCRELLGQWHICPSVNQPPAINQSPTVNQPATVPMGSSPSTPAHLWVGCGIALGLALTYPVAAIAQPDELQQLEDFLTPTPAEAPQWQTPQQFAPSPTIPSTPIPPTPSPSIPAVVPPPSPSQSQRIMLSLNSHNPGTLGNPRQLQEGFYQDLFQFEGQTGEFILLNLIGSDDPRMQLDPRLQLIGPDGSLVAEDDNSGYDSDRGDARIVVSLPNTGLYTIVVTTAEPDDRGRYTLGLLEVDDPSSIQ